MGTISYGFGADYLKHWTIKEALREVFQNYIDYGEYSVNITPHDYYVDVCVHNTYIPDNLEFLRIGNSMKNGKESIGQYGEGLKMAFLIFLRDNYEFSITTNKYKLTSHWKDDPAIGKTMEIKYDDIEGNNLFITRFTCNTDVFNEFYNNIIRPEDIVFSDDYYGDIVNKFIGNIYSGGLYVCNIPKLSRAYNLKPQHVKLDRDRRMPSSFDISWATSKLNEKYDFFKHEDLDKPDLAYVSNITSERASQYKPIIVEKNVEFIHKESKTLVSNTEFKAALKQHINTDDVKRKSRKEIVKEKTTKARRKNPITLLKEFKKKHCSNVDAKEDIDIIIKQVKLRFDLLK